MQAARKQGPGPGQASLRCKQSGMSRYQELLSEPDIYHKSFEHQFCKVAVRVRVQGGHTKEVLEPQNTFDHDKRQKSAMLPLAFRIFSY